MFGDDLIDININNINENEEENNNFENTHNKVGYVVIIFIVLVIVIFNIYQVFYLVGLIKRAYNLLPRKTFEECYLYNGLSDLLLEFYSFFLGMDLLFLCFLPFFNITLDVFLDNYNGIFVYINYLVFGPFTLGALILCLAHSDKLLFICVRYRPENKIMNFKILFFLLIASLFSLLFTFLGIWYFGAQYFDNSLSFRPSGNHLFGYFFWKYGLNRSRRLRDRINFNNINQIINNDIVVGEQNNDEVQNLMN
jgi:hypothetical protein